MGIIKLLILVHFPPLFSSSHPTLHQPTYPPTCLPSHLPKQQPQNTAYPHLSLSFSLNPTPHSTRPHATTAIPTQLHPRRIRLPVHLNPRIYDQGLCHSQMPVFSRSCPCNPVLVVLLLFVVQLLRSRCSFVLPLAVCSRCATCGLNSIDVVLRL